LALILDLDGVIVDSNPVHVQVWGEYLRRHGVDNCTSLPERMYGRRNDEIVRDLFGQHLSTQEVLAHGAAKEALYRQAMQAQLAQRLVPGVVGFLERHRGTPTGLASNAEPANVEFVLREAGLRDYFSAIVDGHQVERPKPDPQVYLRAASLLGILPRDCIVFEDSEAGVQSARAAGARVVALRTTHACFPQADLVIENFLSPELELWLGRQQAQR
jgi:HAD superfamily hydrolase (TIGR01509 family)